MFRLQSRWLTGVLALGLVACPDWTSLKGAEDVAGEGPLPCAVSTWRFGRTANRVALNVLASGGSAIDAVERGIRMVEADATNNSVGIGGTPNAAGVVQLDACIMDGVGHRAGSVAGLEDILHPISVARRVMESTPHVLLVGEGARQFAMAQGSVPTRLLTESRRRGWEQWKQQQDKSPRGPADAHDTIALIVVDADGHLAGGCSTSGWGYKLPGRVGDSPILGAGLYVDDDIGGAGATGVGENVMRYCGSFMIVEAMRHGLSPQQACEAAIRRIVDKDPRPVGELHINFIAVNKRGECGAAGTDRGFEFAVGKPGRSRVEPAKWMEGESGAGE